MEEHHKKRHKKKKKGISHEKQTKKKIKFEIPEDEEVVVVTKRNRDVQRLASRTKSRSSATLRAAVESDEEEEEQEEEEEPIRVLESHQPGQIAAQQIEHYPEEDDEDPFKMLMGTGEAEGGCRSFPTFLRRCWSGHFPKHVSESRVNGCDYTDFTNDLRKDTLEILTELTFKSESSSKLYTKIDVRRVGWDLDSKCMIEATPTRDEFNANPSVVTPNSLKKLRRMMKEEGGVTIFRNLDLISPDCVLSKLLKSIDDTWGTSGRHGSSEAKVFVRPAKKSTHSMEPFPPYSMVEDHIIVQLVGTQRISLIDRNLLQDHPSYIDLDLRANNAPITIHQFDPADIDEELFHNEELADDLPPEGMDAELEEGDYLFVPQGYVVVIRDRRSLGKKIWSSFLQLYDFFSDSIVDVKITLPALFECETATNLISNYVLSQANEFWYKKSPSVDDFGPKRMISRSFTEGLGAYTSVVQKIFNADGLKNLQSQILQLEARGKFSRIDFVLDDPNWMKRKLCRSKEDLESFSLQSIVKNRGGIVRINDFLPVELAQRIEQAIKAALPDEWAVAENGDPTYNVDAYHAKHKFYASKRFPYAQPIFRILRSLWPEAEAVFSAGSYRSSEDFIEPHDDRAYQTIFDKLYSRSIAMVYYLTPNDWSYEEDGGGFVDYGPPTKNGKMDTNYTPKLYNPAFNSLVLFSVPRWHAVRPVLRPNGNRLSIFGWFLQHGKLYQL